jgi:hypothetical protein
MKEASMDEENKPPHTKPSGTLEAPKICFSSPTPRSSPCENQDRNVDSVRTLNRHHVEGKDGLKRKFRYPLIVGKLSEEARKIFRVRNKNEQIKHSKNDKTSSLAPRAMDTLRVPTLNQIRKSTNSGILPKVHKKLDVNSKPYYVLQDTGLSNLLHYNQPKFTNRKPLTINKRSEIGRNNAAMISNHVNGHLTDQLDKLEHIDLPHSQSPQKQNFLSINKTNTVLHTRAGWMSPAPYTEKEEGRNVTVTRNTFSYNFV